MMKRILLLFTLFAIMTSVMAQSYKMVVHVNNGSSLGFPDGKISIPVDNIQEMTFEEIPEGEDPVIPEGTLPILFRFSDYSTPTRSPLRKAPAIDNRKYGVFGCYHQGEELSQNNISSNLLNNQLVENVSGSWEYSPIAYWPESGKGKDYVSFFAYSPFADNGNKFVSVNTDAQEPTIDYFSFNPIDDNGDLLYGSSINANSYYSNAVNIESKHALCRLNFTAVLGNNKNGPITIKSVKISGKIPERGSFNLYRQEWTNLSTNENTFTAEGDDINASLRDAGDTDENQPEGVTFDSKPISVSPFLLIPTGESTKFTVSLTLCTKVKVDWGSDDSDENYQKKEMTLPMDFNVNLKAGNSYNIDFKIYDLERIEATITNSAWEDESEDISIDLD